MKRVPLPHRHIDPALLQGPLGGQPLPFIDEGVSRDPRLQRAIGSLLQCLDRPLEGLEEEDAHTTSLR